MTKKWNPYKEAQEKPSFEEALKYLKDSVSEAIGTYAFDEVPEGTVFVVVDRGGIVAYTAEGVINEAYELMKERAEEEAEEEEMGRATLRQGGEEKTKND